MNKLDYRKILKMSVMVVLSSLLQSISLSSFSVPAGLYPSGIAGISRLSSDILLDFLNINIPYQVFYFTANILLGILVFKYIGKYFTIFSVLQTTFVSIFSSFMPKMFALSDPLLMALFGGIINGTAAGVALKANASTGGMDFISIYFMNKFNKSMWNKVFMFNCLVVAIAGLIYGWEIACYTIIFQFVTTQVVNRMHKRFTHQSLNIITKYPDKVTENILKTTRHGITQIRAMGSFSKEDTTMLYMVINSYQVDEVVSSILEVDKKAFISIANVKEVIGNYYQKPLD